PTPTTRSSDRPISQPKTREQPALIAAMVRITGVRPNRSANTPASSEAIMAVRWDSDVMYAPRAAPRVSSDPAATKQAARNAGVQAHMPSSSHEWNVYPAMTSMAGRFLSTSAPKRWPPARALTTLAVERRATQATTPPMTGPDARSQNASREP